MSAQLPPELPTGWLYIDLKSLRSQWEPPTEPPPGHLDTAPSFDPSNGAPQVPSGWTLQWHESYGAWFFTNSQNGKSQWNFPRHAAISATDYSPVDYTHKPTSWGLDDPTRTVVDNLFLASQQQGKRQVPHLYIDTNYVQVRQRPVSPHYTFIPPTRPRAISDCPPPLPDIPMSSLTASHPATLNPFSKTNNGFLAASDASRRHNRHSFCGSGFGSAYLNASQLEIPPTPESSGCSRASTIDVGQIVSLITMSMGQEEASKRNEHDVVSPILTSPPGSKPPTLDPFPPGHRPLSEIRQMLRTETIGYTQGTWPVGAEDRGYYPTRVSEDGEGGYVSDSSYSTEYAEDEDEEEVEKERPPEAGFTPVIIKSEGPEAWELSY
ncbi:unnamed protein product [Clonostachys solani]|uniref:WW domain-containing protein n=1 Tax=Clonostachys solani TaxID=160281 RepID=A0A9N9Z9X4_9HYPO|nr:unnamed protein product [Clonostachys solani]